MVRTGSLTDYIRGLVNPENFQLADALNGVFRVDGELIGKDGEKNSGQFGKVDIRLLDCNSVADPSMQTVCQKTLAFDTNKDGFIEGGEIPKQQVLAKIQNGEQVDVNTAALSVGNNVITEQKTLGSAEAYVLTYLAVQLKSFPSEFIQLQEAVGNLRSLKMFGDGINLGLTVQEVHQNHQFHLLNGNSYVPAKWLQSGVEARFNAREKALDNLETVIISGLKNYVAQKNSGEKITEGEKDWSGALNLDINAAINLLSEEDQKILKDAVWYDKSGNHYLQRYVDALNVSLDGEQQKMSEVVQKQERLNLRGEALLTIANDLRASDGFPIVAINDLLYHLQNPNIGYTPELQNRAYTTYFDMQGDADCGVANVVTTLITGIGWTLNKPLMWSGVSESDVEIYAVKECGDWAKDRLQTELTRFAVSWLALRSVGKLVAKYYPKLRAKVTESARYQRMAGWVGETKVAWGEHIAETRLAKAMQSGWEKTVKAMPRTSNFAEHMWDHWWTPGMGGKLVDGFVAYQLVFGDWNVVIGSDDVKQEAEDVHVKAKNDRMRTVFNYVGMAWMGLRLFWYMGRSIYEIAKDMPAKTGKDLVGAITKESPFAAVRLANNWTTRTLLSAWFAKKDAADDSNERGKKAGSAFDQALDFTVLDPGK